MQIKTTMKYHFTSTRIARSKRKNTSFGEDEEKLQPSYITGGNGKWCRHFGKQFGHSSTS